MECLGRLWTLTAHVTFFDCLLLSSGLLLGLWALGRSSFRHFARRGIPSTTPRWPFLGDSGLAFLGLRSLPDTVLELYSKSSGLGLYGFFQFRTPVVMLRDPEVIKMATVKQFDQFMNHRNVMDIGADPIFDKNLFQLKDQQWREMRKTLSPAFTSSKIKGLFPLIKDSSQQMANYLLQEYNKYCKGEKQKPWEVDMKNLFSRFATDVIGTAAFGVTSDSMKEPNNTFHQMGSRLTTIRLTQLLTIAGWVIAPWLMRIFKPSFLDPRAITFFSSVVKDTISEREKKDIHRPDMIQLLMQARDGEIKTEAEEEHETEKIDAARKKLTEEDIIAQAVIFFFAGFETVSTALCFSTLAISQHPEVQEKLHKEIDEALERTGGNLTYEACQEMKYLDMVIHEALRFYPVLSATDRQCVADAVLSTAQGPMRLCKGDNLIVPVLGLHRDPAYWPEPSEFRPERFSDENRPNINPYTYMPFGVGPRICIGQRFALVELKLALVNLLANFQLSPSPKLVTPIQYEKGLNMSIKGGFWCTFTPRKT